MINPPPPESSLFPDPESRPQHTVMVPDPGKRRLLTYVAIAAVITGIVTYYFGFSEETAPVVPVMVQAESEPAKERPEQPGGIDIPYRDVGIYDKIAKGDNANRTVEHLLPASEAPKVEAAPVQAIESKPLPVEEKQVEPAKVESTTAKPAETAPAAKVPPVAIEKGSYRVQLGAFPDQAKAKAELAMLQSKYGTLLDAAKLSIIKADLGAKGIYYRIQSSGLSAKTSDKICADIKALKGSCLIVKP